MALVLPWFGSHMMPAARTAKAEQFSNMGASLIFGDFEVESEEKHAELRPAKDRQYILSLKDRLTYFSSTGGPFCAKLLRDAKHFAREVALEQSEPDAVVLASKLSAIGYSVTVRTALGGGAACFRNLRHEFLAIHGTGDFEGVEFLVEPRFREQFLIPHPSELYMELLSCLPDIFVGTAARLIPVVQVMCTEMADSFESKGLSLPPWRRTQSMLSKWMPARVRDTSFSRASVPVEGSAAAAAVGAGPIFTRMSDPIDRNAPVAAEGIASGGAAVNMAWQQADPKLSFVPFAAADGEPADVQQPGGHSYGEPPAELLQPAPVLHTACSKGLLSARLNAAQQAAAAATAVRVTVHPPAPQSGGLPIHTVKRGFVVQQ